MNSPQWSTATRKPLPAEPQSPLLQRYPPAALPDDHVIEHVNVQQLAGQGQEGESYP